MTDLINRLSKLDAPDREVDADICIALQYVTQKGATNIRRDTDEEFKDEWLDFEVDGELWTEKTPELTASVDAAVSLTDRMLPGANVLMGWGQTNETKPWARIGVIPSHDATGFNLATALCIALLRAKEATNGQ